MKKIFKCEACGGHLTFNPETQDLVCEHCKTPTIINKTNQTPPSQIQYSSRLRFDKSIEIGTAYKCSACETKIASANGSQITRCPSCGNQELTKINETQLHPMNIIPFQLSKKKASACYKKWINSRKFAPNNLKKMARQQKISGYYAPIYLFDFEASTHYSAHGITEKRNSDGTTHTSRRYINEVEICDYDDFIYSANRKINSDDFRKLGGFDPNGIIPYSDEYMLGFLGLGTNRTIHSALDLTEEEIAKIEQSKIMSRLNFKYNRVESFRANTSLSRVWCDYVYVPIWSNHYCYKGKEYHCYINGQTGKVYGKSPKSIWKILGFTALIIACIALLAFLLK